jgi:hypothetical protein
VSVEAMVEIRPRRGLPERVWLTEGGAPKQALSGTAEVRILAEGGEAPAGSPELLAALEVERLRAALRRAWELKDLADVCDYCGAKGPPCDRYGAYSPILSAEDLQHDEDCPFTALSAPPPDLGPLKELVVAVQEECIAWNKSSPDGPPERLAQALSGALEMFPSLRT